MHTQHQKKYKRKLYEKNPYCPVCGVLMILPEDLAVHASGKIKYFPPNTCTLEHTYSRLDPRRYTVKHTNTIMCSKCNNELNHIEQSSLPKEELHLRSGRQPKLESA